MNKLSITLNGNVSRPTWKAGCRSLTSFATIIIDGTHRHAVTQRPRRVYRAGGRRAGARLHHVCWALEGQAVKTIEAFADDPQMDIIRQSFSAVHGLQCGFCTPGMLLMARDIISRGRATSPEEIRQELSGNICRCTGYAGIVAAVQLAAERLAREGTPQ